MTSEERQEMRDEKQWQELGQQLRVDAVRTATAAGSGHPTSSMSAADLIAVLLAGGSRGRNGRGVSGSQTRRGPLPTKG